MQEYARSNGKCSLCRYNEIWRAEERYYNCLMYRHLHHNTLYYDILMCTRLVLSNNKAVHCNSGYILCSLSAIWHHDNHNEFKLTQICDNLYLQYIVGKAPKRGDNILSVLTSWENFATPTPANTSEGLCTSSMNSGHYSLYGYNELNTASPVFLGYYGRVLWEVGSGW